MSKVTWAFIFHSVGASGDQKSRLVVEGEGITSVLVPVHDNDMALKVAAELADDGVQFIELCGAFFKYPGFVEQISAATKNKLPVGGVSFTDKAARDIGAIFAASAS